MMVIDVRRAGVGAGALASGVIAFSASAQQHALDVLIAQGACGNPAAFSGVQVLGHCMTCWASGAGAAGLALALGLVVTRRLRPAVA